MNLERAFKHETIKARKAICDMNSHHSSDRDLRVRHLSPFLVALLRHSRTAHVPCACAHTCIVTGGKGYAMDRGTYISQTLDPRSSTSGLLPVHSIDTKNTLRERTMLPPATGLLPRRDQAPSRCAANEEHRG